MPNEITTNAGKFKALSYAANATGVGCSMSMEFLPGSGVDAESFGFVQMVNTVNGGSVSAINPTVKNRSIPAGEAGAGNHVDNFPASPSPLYAASQPAGNTAVSGSTSHAALQFGHRYVSGGSTLKKKATLRDSPKLPGAGANSSQKFETTVLATKGTQANTYYGSVTWGWETNSAGVYKKLPMTLKSMGAPSAIFRRAAEVWNASKDSTGRNSVDLPLPAQPAATGTTGAEATGSGASGSTSTNRRPGMLGVRGCFVAGTPVMLATGESIAIEALEAGAEIAVFDEDARTMTTGSVKQLHRYSERPILAVHVNGLPLPILCTAEHPFHVRGEWRDAGDLTAGDDLTHYDPDLRELSPRRVLDVVEVKQHQAVFNLGAVPHHNYLVDGMLVHNKYI